MGALDFSKRPIFSLPLFAVLASALFVASTLPASAKDHRRDRHSVYSGDHRGGHNLRGRHHVRNTGLRGRHLYRRSSNRHYSNYGFLSGIMTGYISHGLTHRYRASGYYPRYYGHMAPAQVTVIREVNAVASSPQTGTFGACLQQREYQTLVTVGDRDVEAYGTACLQPDGSWLRGPVKLPPNF